LKKTRLFLNTSINFSRKPILHGRRIFERSRFAFDLTAATLLGIYARFNEDRQEVLHAIGDARWKDLVVFCKELGITIAP
jgi:hypothetical protein